MIRNTLGLLVLNASLLSQWAIADADLSLLKDFAGFHPLLSADAQMLTGGSLEVLASSAQVGIDTRPQKLASEPAPKLSYLGPAEKVDLVQRGPEVIQSFTLASHTIEIRYEKQDGYFTVNTKDCPPQGQCGEHYFVASLGRSPGKEISLKDWAATIQGNYKIELAGGETPKEINSVATVDVSSDPAMAIFWMPFCLSALCDPGENDVPYHSARAFLDEREARKVVRLFIPERTAFRYYAWEVKAGRSVFKNFQYSLSDSKVGLEHVLIGPHEGS